MFIIIDPRHGLHYSRKTRQYDSLAVSAENIYKVRSAAERAAARNPHAVVKIA